MVWDPPCATQCCDAGLGRCTLGMGADPGAGAPPDRWLQPATPNVSAVTTTQRSMLL